jgi:hypothetical protein
MTPRENGEQPGAFRIEQDNGDTFIFIHDVLNRTDLRLRLPHGVLEERRLRQWHGNELVVLWVGEHRKPACMRRELVRQILLRLRGCPLECVRLSARKMSAD